MLLFTSLGLICLVFSWENDAICGTRVTERRKLIVNGEEAQPYDFPWQVGLLQTSTGDTFCGGSIISREYILTAAHCLDVLTEEQFRVLIGSYDVDDDQSEHVMTLKPRQIIQHENWDSITEKGWDIALIRLEDLIPEWNDAVRPICLPEHNALIPFGKTITVSGYGKLDDTLKNSEKKMYTTEMEIWNPYRCVPGYTLHTTGAMGTDEGRAFCLKSYSGSPDPINSNAYSLCQGDSGGPDVILHDDGRFYQHGINSMVMLGCGNALFPDFVERVSYHIDWIEETIANADSTRAPSTTPTENPTAPSTTPTENPTAKLDIQIQFNINKYNADDVECANTTESSVLSYPAETCYLESGNYIKYSCIQAGVILQETFYDSNCSDVDESKSGYLRWKSCFQSHADDPNDEAYNYFLHWSSTPDGGYCQPRVIVGVQRFSGAECSGRSFLRYDWWDAGVYEYCHQDANGNWHQLDCAEPGRLLTKCYADPSCQHEVGCPDEVVINGRTVMPSLDWQHGECADYGGQYGVAILTWSGACEPNEETVTTTMAISTTTTNALAFTCNETQLSAVISNNETCWDGYSTCDSCCYAGKTIWGTTPCWEGNIEDNYYPCCGEALKCTLPVSAPEGYNYTGESLEDCTNADCYPTLSGVTCASGFHGSPSLERNQRVGYSKAYCTTVNLEVTLTGCTRTIECKLPTSPPLGYVYDEASLENCSNEDCSSPTVNGVTCAEGFVAEESLEISSCSARHDFIVGLEGCHLPLCSHENIHYICERGNSFTYTLNTCEKDYLYEQSGARDATMEDITCPSDYTACVKPNGWRGYAIACESSLSTDEAPWYSCYDCALNKYVDGKTGCVLGGCVRPGLAWATLEGSYADDFDGAATVDENAKIQLQCSSNTDCSSCLSDSNCVWATGANYCYYNVLDQYLVSEPSLVPGVQRLHSNDIAQCNEVGNEYLITYVGESCTQAGKVFHSVQDFTYGICRDTLNDTTSFIVQCNYPSIHYTRYPNLGCSGTPEVYDFESGLDGCQEIGQNEYMLLQWSGCDSETENINTSEDDNKSDSTESDSTVVIIIFVLVVIIVCYYVAWQILHKQKLEKAVDFMDDSQPEKTTPNSKNELDVESATNPSSDEMEGRGGETTPA